MTGRTSECNQPEAAAPKTRRLHYTVLGTVCALVIGVYAWSAKSGWVELWSWNAENTYYNLLVQGFRAGQLNLKREVPSGVAQLADPYDPKAISPYLAVQNPLLDQSYYQGKLYLYFGVTPALVLFWPYVALTGHYLLHKDAVVIFFSVGFLASVGLLWGVWRRYFAAVGVGVVAVGTLALGVVNLAPAILQRCDVYEVAISCGYALTMMTLMLLWRAMHAARGRIGWLAGASLAYGLALGARPSLLCGAVILLVPVAAAWRERGEPGQRRQAWMLLLAATVPIMLIGMGLMLYNTLRFENPFEFGQRYQLNESEQGTMPQFGLQYLWYNFHVGFLEPAQWSGHFPFVHDIALPPLPHGGATEQLPFGVLTNVPVVWLALAVPLAWRGRSAEGRAALRWSLATVVALFGTSALILCLHNSMTLRYEVEFLSALVLLAVLGILGLERTLVGRRVWRRATRWGWGLLLAFSVAFNLFAMLERYAEAYLQLGLLFVQKGQAEKAIVHFQKALELQPENPRMHNGLGYGLLNQGKASEAISHFEQALRLKPDFVQAQNNLAGGLFQLGKMAEAVGCYEQVLRLDPGSAEVHNSLGKALFELDRMPEAIGHLEVALRLEPENAEVRNNLGLALCRLDRMPEAIGHLEVALRRKPDFAEAHNSLGFALFRQGLVVEAVGHYEQALRFKPDFVEAHNNLAVALFEQGKEGKAIEHVKQATGLRPDDADGREKLGLTLARQGKATAAAALFSEVVRLRPDAPAHYNLALALVIQGNREAALDHYRQAIRLKPDWAVALNDLAWILATHPKVEVRNGAEAVRLAERACELSDRKEAGFLGTLDAAYAEAGRFSDAIATAKQARELAIATGRKEMAEQTVTRLKLYESGRPYHQE